MNKAIFLDRDGVINRDKGHVHKIEDCEFFPDTFKALQKAPENFKLIVITNQAGIAKGYYTEKILHKFTAWMLDKFKKNDIKIDKVYYCPHHPDGVVEKYTINCDCRKPAPGMLKQAAKEFDLNLRECWLIGDNTSDVKSGQNAGCTTILIKTGRTSKDQVLETAPDYEVETLSEAIEIIDSKSSYPLKP